MPTKRGTFVIKDYFDLLPNSLEHAAMVGSFPLARIASVAGVARFSRSFAQAGPGTLGEPLVPKVT